MARTGALHVKAGKSYVSCGRASAELLRRSLGYLVQRCRGDAGLYRFAHVEQRPGDDPADALHAIQIAYRLNRHPMSR
jgi:hypothetical protein